MITTTQIDEQKLKISREEYLRRKYAIDFTNSSFALEGFTPDAELVRLSNLYIQGEIDSDEFSRLCMEHIDNG